MNSAGFDPANWSHWLLLGCCGALSIYALMLSWRWNESKRTRRKWHRRMKAQRRQIEQRRIGQIQIEQKQVEHRKVELARQLATNSYEASRSLQKRLNLSTRDASQK